MALAPAMLPRNLATALTMVALLAACGGGAAERATAPAPKARTGDRTNATSTNGTGTSTTTSATPGARGTPDDGRAEAIVLKLADFPKGWQQRAHSVEDGRFDSKLKACIGLPPRVDAPSAKAVFSRGKALQVSSAAQIVGSADVARSYFDTVNGPRLNRCLERTFERFREAGGAGSVDTHVEDVPFPPVGEGSLARRITFRAQSATSSAMVVIDVVLAVKDRIEMALGFTSVGHPFPRDLAVRLAQAMAARA